MSIIHFEARLELTVVVERFQPFFITVTFPQWNLYFSDSALGFLVVETNLNLS